MEYRLNDFVFSSTYLHICYFQKLLRKINQKTYIYLICVLIKPFLQHIFRFLKQRILGNNILGYIKLFCIQMIVLFLCVLKLCLKIDKFYIDMEVLSKWLDCLNGIDKIVLRVNEGYGILDIIFNFI